MMSRLSAPSRITGPAEATSGVHLVLDREANNLLDRLDHWEYLIRGAKLIIFERASLKDLSVPYQDRSILKKRETPVRIHIFVILATLFTLAFGASLTMAAGIKTVTGTISGSVTASDLTSDACPAVTDAKDGIDTYDAICSDPGSCICLSVTRLSLSGGFGKGTASLFVTVDENAALTTSSNVGACAPAFGVITLTIPAKGKTAEFAQTINAVGSVCGTAQTTTLVALGGFSIEASSANPESSGSGTFNGTVSTAGALSIKLSGLIANP
jgi:hypothetical protein